MFVKDRALAKNFIGKEVASGLVTMHDGMGVNEVATYDFDDEGTCGHDTVIIKNGILQTGISDAKTAGILKTKGTGNGRRENYEHKAYVPPRKMKSYRKWLKKAGLKCQGGKKWKR